MIQIRNKKKTVLRKVCSIRKLGGYSSELREKVLKTSMRFEAAASSSVDKKQLHVNCARDVTFKSILKF